MLMDCNTCGRLFDVDVWAYRADVLYLCECGSIYRKDMTKVEPSTVDLRGLPLTQGMFIYASREKPRGEA